MLNSSIIILLLLVLVSKNIVLLNEESLILMCFVTFCWVSFIKFRDLINVNFEEKISNIHGELKDSFNSILKVLSINLRQKESISNFIFDFHLLKNYCCKINKIITGNLPFLRKKTTQKVYIGKFFFIKRLEQRVAKLIVLMLAKKIERIASLEYFFATKIKVLIFIHNYKISLKEYIKIM